MHKAFKIKPETTMEAAANLVIDDRHTTSAWYSRATG
jgi:hypothetical protein